MAKYSVNDEISSTYSLYSNGDRNLLGISLDLPNFVKIRKHIASSIGNMVSDNVVPIQNQILNANILNPISVCVEDTNLSQYIDFGVYFHVSISIVKGLKYIYCTLFTI